MLCKIKKFFMFYDLCYNIPMSILNPLPELLSYSFVAPLFLRIVISVYFLKQFSTIVYTKYFTKEDLRVKNTFKVLIGIKTISALALLVGFYTQIAVLILIILTAVDMFMEHQTKKLKKIKLQFYIFILVILLSLLVTGAGFFSIDLPL